MKNRLFIIGAGGHGKVIADIAQRNRYTDIAFLDDYAEGERMGVPIVGKVAELVSLDDGAADFVIAIGSNAARRQLAEQYDVNYVSLVHPTAVIGTGVTFGRGTVVMAGAVINPCAQLGEHCIVNTCAVVEHDNVLGSYVHISPNAALGGTVHIGAETHIGIGACVRNNTDICEACTIGAGAVVVKNIEESGTYVGVPARKIK